jgi:hypothetical protein
LQAFLFAPSNAQKGALTLSAMIERSGLSSLDSLERLENNVPCPFYQGEKVMVRAVAEEALALASVSLFLAMVAVWAQVLGVV